MGMEADYDALILDLGLPDIPGEKICMDLRERNVHTPILVLTGEDGLDSKVRLLDCGADDYLTKPFEAAELLARIKALVRRHTPNSSTSRLKIGDLIIDPKRRRVERAGIHIPLRRKEFDILEYLARNSGTIVTPAMILEHVWNDYGKDAWSNTVRVHIKHLRDKVDRPFDTQLIKTARGVGYVLENS